jgi:lipid A ethanolaminephosphotransferase
MPFHLPTAPARALPTWTRRSPTVSVETLAALAALYFALFANGAFWGQALAGRDWRVPATWWFAAAVLAALGGLHFGLLLLVLTRAAARWTLTLLLLATAVASHFTSSYGVYLDPNMIRNMLQSETKEVADLLGRGLLLHVLLQAGPAIVVVWWLGLGRDPWGKAAARRAIAGAVATALTATGVLAGFQGLAGLIRDHRPVRYLVTPANYLYSIARAAAATKPRAARAPIGADAKLASSWRARQRPALFVIVVGETVRAANWGLDGYARQTTPLLAGLDPINFRDVTACGTDTETSLPCLFAAVGRRDYDERRIRSSESLLHVLARAGFQVRWRDNQTGCKGVCNGLPYEQVDIGTTVDCQPGRCLDEHLLDGLDPRIAAAGTEGPGQVLVLHAIGNHGPAYFARYPETDRLYTPTCDTTELSRCSAEAIVNSYDNAIRYADRFLAMTVDFLRRHAATHDTALLYVSDHGESLGEHGLFLHGLPYAIAPQVQTRVPMVLWLSEGFRSSFAIDQTCLRDRAGRPLLHDHVFHTVLGLLDVRTSARDRQLDLAEGCRVDQPEAGDTAARLSTASQPLRIEPTQFELSSSVPQRAGSSRSSAPRWRGRSSSASGS